MTEHKQIKSPVTSKYNVILEEEISCQIIIKAYAKNYGIDVSEYFDEIESVKIYKCLDTRYRFYYPFSLSGNNKLYEELQKTSEYYGIRPEHEVAKSFIKANDLILEIGCGSGLFLQKLKEIGLLCTGLEFNEQAVSAGGNKGLNILKQDICEHAKNNYEKYDVVCSFQVLEHISSVHDFINASLKVLKPGGKLIVAVPNNNPFLYKYDKYHTLNLPPHHMGLWNKESLKNLQNFYPLKVNKIWIEPLNTYDYEHYFKIQTQYFNSQIKFLNLFYEYFLLKMQPTKFRRKLQKLVSKFVQGRNILAVYTKS